MPITDLISHTPSQLGWPKLVANKLGVELINMSYPGSSNFEILYTLLEFKFEKDDIVVIMWSHYLRDLFFTRLFKSLFFRRRLGLWKKTVIGRRWIDQMSERDYAMKTWVYMHHADLHLKSNNIKYIHYPSAPNELTSYYSPVKIDNLYTNGLVVVDRGADNQHPGLESNKIMADVIYGILNEK